MTVPRTWSGKDTAIWIDEINVITTHEAETTSSVHLPKIAPSIINPGPGAKCVLSAAVYAVDALLKSHA
jgi:hypothetical protein